MTWKPVVATDEPQRRNDDSLTKYLDNDKARVETRIVALESSSVRLIERQKLAASAASVTLTPPASGYRSLEMVAHWQDASTGDLDLRLRFNADTAANYSYYSIANLSTFAPAAVQVSSGTYIRVGTGYDTTYRFSVSTVKIPEYQNNTHKSLVHTSYNPRVAAGQAAEVGGGIWHSTAAITSIVLSASTGNLSLGSSFSLYGYPL